MTIRTADPRIKLPPPNYLVEQIVEGKKHFYGVTHDDGRKEKFGGTTGYLGVISKPALIQWSANQAALNAELALMARLGGKKTAKINLTEDWIKSVIDESKKRPEKIKDEAAEIGTAAHRAFDCHILGKPHDVDSRVRGTVDAFLEWSEKESGLAFLAGDTCVASIEHKVGGALDCLAMVVDESKIPKELNLRNGDYILGDFKTAGSIYPEVRLQLGSYWRGLSETYGIDAVAGIVMRFDKIVKPGTPGWEVKWVPDLKKGFDAFLHAKALQEALKEKCYV